MHGTHIVAPIVCGCACIAVAVIPGLLSGLKDGMVNLHRSFPIYPRHRRSWHASEKSNERIWFVIAGVAFLLLAAFASISS